MHVFLSWNSCISWIFRHYFKTLMKEYFGWKLVHFKNDSQIINFFLKYYLLLSLMITFILFQSSILFYRAALNQLCKSNDIRYIFIFSNLVLMSYKWLLLCTLYFIFNYVSYSMKMYFKIKEFTTIKHWRYKCKIYFYI